MVRAGSLTGPTLSAGAKFGRYTIVRPIGAGGMGAVYEALQDTPRRSVALKVIRGNWLSPQMLRRFEHESQVLGRLQHPGIAQVYEAGWVEEGEHGAVLHGSESRATRSGATPFFAMELIKGVPLTEYAAAKQLGTRERLELVARICDAVYHAHQKGVIHRDLKPANILVDESGQPKILDFGVARATDSDIQQTTMQTDIGQLIGTVPYMSPEQVSGDPNDLDTRSDVYALGVIAYELLAGRLPYDLQKKMIHEAVRVIREEEPTRLSFINRTLRGDIETIVGKALEKDKARRYQSAEALGSDIRRYLKDEPIAARPASTWYQAAKFARRNKVLVGGIAATFLVLIAGIIGVSLMLKRALEAEHNLGVQVGETTAALKKAQEAEAETARRAGELQQVSDFQEKMLAQVDPTTAGVWLTEDVTKRLAAALEKAGVAEEDRRAQIDTFRQQWVKVNATDAARELIDRTILRPAVKAIDEQFKDQPLVDAQLRQVLADRYRELGLYDAALPLQAASLETRRRLLEPSEVALLTSVQNMGILLRALGRSAEAEPFYVEAMSGCRQSLGPEHPLTLRAISNLGVLLRTMDRPNEAEPLYREAMDTRRRVLGLEHPDTLVSVNNLAVLLSNQGRFQESETLQREAIEARERVLGPYHADTLFSLTNLGFLLQQQGRLPEAESCYSEALHGRQQALGADHPDTLQSMHNLSVLRYLQGRLGEAEDLARRALQSRQRVLGNAHSATLDSMNALGVIAYHQGRFSDAEVMYRLALDEMLRVWGDQHETVLITINNLALALRSQDKHQETTALLAPAEQAFRARFGRKTDVELARALSTLGHSYIAARYGEEFPTLAEANLLEAHSIFVQVRGETHKDTLESVQSLVDLYTAWHAAEPDKGYDTKATEWRKKLDEAK